MIAPSFAWKLVLAISLAGAIFASACLSPPRRKVGGNELRLLVCAAILLYTVGAVASLSRRPELAAILYAGGIAASALSAWLSRGADAGEEPPRGPEPPVDEHPPAPPDGSPRFDWPAFERDFRAYERGHARERVPAR